ncbi:hypothetical protein AAF712_004464 [Marasmius tenuissimus]|uniref:DUF6532 domain-containing protein n=1 Tax=Marasmius tenuissimus TaxID=585030 RepID=A0ABR3A4W9_9AGAR
MRASHRHCSGEGLAVRSCYASLSIFGSLGIVKTAFATLLATTTKPFYGGWWLSDAGFGTTGSVSSMVTLVKDTKQYGAEVRLQQLLKEQHIDDLELVKGIEWYGWRRSNSTEPDGSDQNGMDGKSSLVSSPFSNLSWNASLILSSTVLSLVGITPYLHLIHNHWERALLWLFPILRSFGSLLCVVSVQLALQIRIHRITTASLLLMKARKRYPLKIDEAVQDRETLLELRLRKLQDEVRDKLGRDPDPEKQLDRDYLTELQGVLEVHTLTENALIFLLQAVLLAGMAMIVAGYVGCFNMVSRTDVPNGPYVWFGMETGLAVLRIALWGWNPSWDEGNTGMTMQLALHSKNLAPCTPPVFLDPESSNDRASISPDTPDKNNAVELASTPTISFFPLITTSRRLSRLISPINHTAGYEKENKETFVAESVHDFLSATTPHVGPLPRLTVEELEDILLYYAIVPDLDQSCERKLLCMTICRSDSKWTSISVFINGDNSHTVFTSHSQDVPGTRALQVTLDTEVELHSTAVTDPRTLDLLLDYSFRLFSQLCTFDTNSGNQLALSWNITLPSSLRPGTLKTSIALTETDRDYLQRRQIYDLKSDYCLQRGGFLPGVFWNDTDREWVLMMETAIMEVYLCILEHHFVQSISLSPSNLRPLALEWIRGMEDRISLEREARRRNWTDAHATFEYEATYDVLVRELRSLRRLHSDSVIIRRWGEIMDRPDQSLSVSDLFALPPLHNLEKLRKGLFPIFTVNGQADVPTPVYHKMIALLRSSLFRLSNMKASSLYDRIDPWGPGSPEFSPPYTQIRQLSEANLSALSLQIDSVQIIEYFPWSSNVHDLLRLLDSLPPSPSLTSLLFSNTSFNNEDLSLIPSIVQRHRKIMCVAFDCCGSVDRAHIDRAIAANCRKWKGDAQNRGGFEYNIGWDLNPAKTGNYTAADMYQNDIYLTDRTDVFAMIHIPQPGKITLNLSAKPGQQHVVNLIASLTRSDSNSIGEADATYEDYMVSFDLVDPDSPEFETVSVGGFPELATGCYELRIQNSFNFLFRKLTIGFTARPAGEESDEKSNIGSGAVEGVMIVQDGEEANGEESSLEVRRPLELHPGTQGKELGDYLGLSRSVVEHSLNDYETLLICRNMFPDPDNHNDHCSDSWNCDCDDKPVPGWELPFNLSAEVSCLMARRGTQFRSASCERIEPLIVPLFGFDTGTHQGDVVRVNQRKYALLTTNSGWYYKDPEYRIGYMEHPIIITAICKTLFYNEKAHGTRSEWEDYFRPVAQNTIAFVFTLIDHCLSKWSTGKYVDREMEEDKLIPVYKRHITRINEWSQLDQWLTRSIRMGWTLQGLAHAKSFLQDESEMELGSEPSIKADSTTGSGSKPDIKAEDQSSSGEDTVEARLGSGTDSVENRPAQEESRRLPDSDDDETEENAQGKSVTEGPGRDSEDVGGTSHAQTEVGGGSFQPDNDVESRKDRENGLRGLPPTRSSEHAGGSGSKPVTDSAKDHRTPEDSPRPGSSLGYANETKEDEKEEFKLTLESPSVGGTEGVASTSHGHAEGKDGT